MKIAIMQPTYLPWAGYFALMNYVDKFVLLDSVQFDRRSWQQSNKILSIHGEQKLTIPVFSKGNRQQLIKEVKIDLESSFNYKHIKTIQQNYIKSEYFSYLYPVLKKLYEKPPENLSKFNSDIIFAIRKILGIETEIIFSSKLDIHGKKDKLLSSICSNLYATEYISPLTSKVYLDKSDSFKEINLDIKYFDYIHPKYKQNCEKFISHLSIIDLIFNCGKESLETINKGNNFFIE